MKEKYKDYLKAELKKNIIEAHKNDPLKDTPMAAVAIMNSAGNFSESVKDLSLEKIQSFGFTKAEYDALIDAVVTEILGEFLSM